MKTLIKHLLENNLEEILSKSLLHCHCLGVHSIILLNSTAKTIRLYVAEKGNELYRNQPSRVSSGLPMAVSFHPHHCNLTIHVVKGILLNWIVKESEIGFEIDKYLYQNQFHFL